MAQRSTEAHEESGRPSYSDSSDSASETSTGTDIHQLGWRCQGREDLKKEIVASEVRGEKEPTKGVQQPLLETKKACTTTKSVFTARELLILSKVFPEIKSQLDALPKVECQEAGAEGPEWLVESDSELEEDAPIECDEDEAESECLDDEDE